MRKLIVPTALLAVVFTLASKAMADTISDVQAFTPTGTTGVVLDNTDPSGDTGLLFPVVTNILSQPGTFNGVTYSSWAFLANDGSGYQNANSGSIDIFGKMPAGNSYTPTVGDAITVTGKYSPFDQIPEMGTLTAIGYPTPAQLAQSGQTATGNPSPTTSPIDTTIPTINVTNLVAQAPGYAGQYLEVDDVTINGFGSRTSFGTTNSPSGGTTLTDSSNNSMVLYYWPTSYGVANENLANKQIPSSTTPVDVFGIVDVFGTGATAAAEFIPINITNTDGSALPNAVPEPGTLVLLGAGLDVAAAAFIRRKLSK